jgi:hypothetical protein
MPRSPLGARPATPGGALQAESRSGHPAGSECAPGSARRPGTKLAPLWGMRLDGWVFAQPLVFQDLVVTATDNDTLYAFEAQTGCLVWQNHLGEPLNGQAAGLCGAQFIPRTGILSTPAIDTSTGTIYLVGYFQPKGFEMVALDMATGTVRFRHPIDLPESDPRYQLSRPAVALANGRAYASFGGRAGDCGNYRGYVTGVKLDGSPPDTMYGVSGGQGSIWAPAGPLVLPNGDLLVATGNSESTKSFDGGNAVVRLSPSLERKAFFAPGNWVQLNQADCDLGSVSPTLLEGGKVFQIGKEGVGYLLDADNLGGVGKQLNRVRVKGRTACIGGSPPSCYAIGATAYDPPDVFVPCDHGVTAVEVAGSNAKVAWQGPDFRADSPILAGALLWNIAYDDGYLWGLDPKTGTVKQKVAIGQAAHFVSPSAGGGRLYVPLHGRLLAFSFS